MLFRNILVPYDGSKYSIHAFKIALDMAQRYDSKITVLTCLELDAQHHLYYESSASPQLIKKQSKIMKKHFEKLELLAKKNNIHVKCQILIPGSAVNRIVSFAKSHKTDLVIIGSHGRTGFDRMLLGSVAQGVSQKVHCPVMIAK